MYRDECEREPWTLVDGGIDQCFMYWMARLGSPYGNRTVTRGVHFVHPAGADFQASALRYLAHQHNAPSSSTGTRTSRAHTHQRTPRVGLWAGAAIQRMPVARSLAQCASCLHLLPQAFSYLGYGERSRARLNLKARNPQIPGALGVELPWHAGMDWVFQPGDLLVHSAHLKRLRNFWPDDAPVNGSVAADAMTTCAVRPNVTYHRRHGRLVFELRGQKKQWYDNRAPGGSRRKGSRRTLADLTLAREGPTY